MEFEDRSASGTLESNKSRKSQSRHHDKPKGILKNSNPNATYHKHHRRKLEELVENERPEIIPTHNHHGRHRHHHDHQQHSHKHHKSSNDEIYNNEKNKEKSRRHHKDRSSSSKHGHKHHHKHHGSRNSGENQQSISDSPSNSDNSAAESASRNSGKFCFKFKLIFFLKNPGFELGNSRMMNLKQNFPLLQNSHERGRICNG